MLIADVYRNPTKSDSVTIGVSEISQTKDGFDKITFYMISSQLSEFAKLTYKQVGEIHEILKKFGSYKPKGMNDGKTVMGVMTAWLDNDMFESVQSLIPKK